MPSKRTNVRARARSSSTKEIAVDRRVRIAIIRLSHAPLNVLNNSMRTALLEALDDLAADRNVRAVVLTGGGNRAFCAGSDIREFPDEMKRGLGAKRAIAERRFDQQILEFPKPIVAAVNGYALGGGLELALLCDFRIAARRTWVGFPEIKLGSFPANAVTLCAHVVGAARAKALMYLGDPLPARDAYRLGLVDRVVPARRVLPEAVALARKLSERTVLGIRYMKAILNGPARLAMERQGTEVAVFLEQIWQSDEARSAVAAFFARRARARST